MLQELFEQSEVAIALIRGAGGGFTQQTRNMATPVTRPGTGVYVCTLAQGIPSAVCRTIATPCGTGAGDCVVEHTSDTVKTIHTFNSGGTATDVDFDASFAHILG